MFSFMNAAIADFGFIAIWCVIFQNGICWRLSQLSYILTTFYVYHNCVILVLSKFAQMIVLLNCIGRCLIQISAMTLSTLFGGFPWFPQVPSDIGGIVPKLGHVCVLHLFNYIRHQSSCYLMLHILK